MLVLGVEEGVIFVWVWFLWATKMDLRWDEDHVFLRTDDKKYSFD